MAAKCDELEQQLRSGNGSLEADLQAALANHAQLAVRQLAPSMQAWAGGCRGEAGGVGAGGRASMSGTWP